MQFTSDFPDVVDNALERFSQGDIAGGFLSFNSAI